MAREAVPFSIPSGNLWEMQVVRMLASTCGCFSIFILALPIGVEWSGSHFGCPLPYHPHTIHHQVLLVLSPEYILYESTSLQLHGSHYLSPGLLQKLPAQSFFLSSSRSVHTTPIWPWLSLQAPATPSLISLCWPDLKLLISAHSFLHTLLGWLTPFFQVFSPMSFFRETSPDRPISSSPHLPWGAVTVWLTYLSVRFICDSSL